MKQVSIFIITSTRSPGKAKKAWYRYMMYCDGHHIDKKQQVLATTGHRLVLECAIAALKRMTKPAMITFFTDCHYFANGQRQLASWRENGWKRSDGKELRNLDLWQQLEELLRPHAISFQMENMELYKNPDETPWS